MADNRKTFGRSTQRSIYPTAVKHRNIASTYIRNTKNVNSSGIEVPYEYGSIVVPDNTKIVVTATYTAGEEQETIVGTAPFMMAFFLNTISSVWQIPFGTSVPMTVGTAVNYQYYAPTAMPDIFTFTDDKKVVVKAGVLNVSGSPQTIHVYTQARLVFGTQVKRRQTTT